MDVATMLVMLLFTDGTTEHFFWAERDMGACMGALGGKSRSRTPESADADYVVYRVCLPVSVRAVRHHVNCTKDVPSDPCGRGNLKTSMRPRTLYLRWTGEIGT